ncbi:RNA polymerase sigma factor [Streptomyces sp. NPDC058614]|uniref:RNA polymerase sigma factor n=1 Tax=Streptomyces sp. NPDC058614 TaxID=3346557 RepID=UPI0036572A80
MKSEHHESPNEASRPPSPLVDSDKPGTFSGFIEAHRERATAYAFRVCGSWHIAEDVVQDIALEVEKHWQEIQCPAAWMRKAIRTRLKNVMPRQRREISAADLYDDAHFLFQAVVATPHDVYAAKELNQEIRRAFAGLSEEKRAILMMSLDGVSQEKIAAHLNMTPGAVGTALVRIKDLLALLLGVPEQRERGKKRGADSKDEKEADA